jgi:hypothetical protein
MELNEKKTIRKLAIITLDDENGVEEDKWSQWKNVLCLAGCSDIVNLVSASDSIYFLGENDAEELLNGLEIWNG